MTRFRMHCPTCGADGTTADEELADELVAMHDEKDGHSPEYEVLDE